MGKSTFVFLDSSIAIDGGITTIRIFSDNQSYSHKLSHSYGTIATLAAGTTLYEYDWAPEAQELTKFFEEIPNQTTRSLDVYLDTYNGSTLVGRYTRSLSVTLSEHTGQPTVKAYITTAQGGTVIIPGKTDVIIDDQSSTKYGAKKLMSQFVYDGKEYPDIYSMMDSFSSQLTTTAKAIRFGYRVTDTRRFSNTQTMQYMFATYVAPSVSSIKFERCDSDGTLNDDGGYAKVSIKGSCCVYTGSQHVRIKLRYSDNPDNPTYSGLIDDIHIWSNTIDASTVLKYGNTDPLLPDGSGGSTNDSDAVPIAFLTNKTYVFSVEIRETPIQYSSGYTETGIRFEGNDLIYISPEGKMTIGSNNNGIFIDDSNVNVRGKNTTVIDSSNKTKIHGRVVEINASEYTSISGYAIQYIPVYTSGDCDNTNFRFTCKAYIGSNGIHKPDTRDGWIEGIAYNTKYCIQTYTTYDGMAKYERIINNGVVGEWRIVYRRLVVSNNTTGSIVYLNPGLYEVSSYEYTTSSDGYRGSRQILYSISDRFVVSRLNDIASANAGVTITTATTTIAGDDPDDPESSKQVVAMTFKNSAKTYTAKICIKQLY